MFNNFPCDNQPKLLIGFILFLIPTHIGLYEKML
jgi:hypothetical protein